MGSWESVSVTWVPWQNQRMTDVSTGTRDPLYNLILLTQQALEDCFRYQHFAEDARAGGDDELAVWFEELAQSDREIAERAKRMLADRLTRADSR